MGIKYQYLWSNKRASQQVAQGNQSVAGFTFFLRGSNVKTGFYAFMLNDMHWECKKKSCSKEQI
jgi:hypothetical protein